MKRSQLILTLAFFLLLLLVASVNHLPVGYGGVPPSGWFGLFFFALSIGVALVITDSRLNRRRVTAQIRVAVEAPPKPASAPLPPTMIDPEGLPYPHPVINVATCIGCHACVDACPHDVLAIVNGKAAPVALEQCMEDTSCQVECPTVPKSCIVVNTTKPIPERKVPNRNPRFETNVPGVYLIGDVSGVPLIKNAINEGGAVIEAVAADLAKPGPPAEYDVAIIGIGPAGLSATALAHQRGMKYVAIEQEQIVATIQQTYQAGKYVFFNPVDQPVKGGIRLEGAGASKEAMIGAWMETVAANGLRINEFESCKDIKREADAFLIETEQDRTKQRVQYRARRVVLAIGNRGTPMRLKVPGEDLRISIASGQMVLPQFCNKCGAKRIGENKFCLECGNKYLPKASKPVEDDKVKYRLSDPNFYVGKHIVVVGAGNSAIEAAVDLAAVRSEDGTSIVAWRDNTVSLVIRSNFKSDLKLGNKMLVYECIDEGRIKAFFGQTLKEITPNEVALMNARERDPKTAAETARIRNDYVFALIGGEKPTRFLENIGVKIG
ncbi:MAG: NAD(P)-binding domain-containing protein [Blastocatellia bacterium]|nr:NAD(P)-binding domain-containing protein [Blastocatellia bacterium]